MIEFNICVLIRYYPGSGRVVVYAWFSPPEFLQEVLAMPAKTEVVLDALLLKKQLEPEQMKELMKDAELGGLQGWAGSFGKDDALIAPGKSELPLVSNLLNSKNIPRAQWADELDFCTCKCAHQFTRCGL